MAGNELKTSKLSSVDVAGAECLEMSKQAAAWSGAGEKRGTRFEKWRLRCGLTNNGQKARRNVPGTGARCGNRNDETQNKSSSLWRLPNASLKKEVL